ncbi:MAG: oxidoreductase, short-chain dehydrogenase/reductase family [Labilithrix sp.]|jgi:short-subunit dehydrogenase|nr:oxidoreductase, short-chain dehydrogenase/reductase family [Labilithrix sp.]
MHTAQGRPERVLILGATSAIASEVARLHVERGDRLHLVGRSRDKLVRLSEAFPTVGSTTADFGELASNETLVRVCIETLGGLDRVLIAHGDLGDQLASEQSFADAEAILRTNFLSVVSLLVPIANHMERERQGRIGVITSVAGDRGRPRNYTYGAAKGGLSIYLQGLRTRLWPADVSVTTLKLGPVDTPMTKDHAKHMLFGKPASVANDIVRAMDGRVPEAYVPSFWGAIMPVVKNTPERIFQLLPFLSGR